MLREMIRAEWARRRVWWMVMLVVYLALPLDYALALGGGAGDGGLEAARGTAGALMAATVLAAAVWGSGVWGPEQRGRWTYTLALPVSRMRLFALRYLAGAGWLALAVLALALAAYLLAATAQLPRLWFAYPGPFVAWTALASWLAYSAGFALGARADDSRRAGSVVLLVLIVAGVASLWQGWTPAWELSPVAVVLDARPLIGR